MGEKCQFCKHECGPLKRPSSKCATCVDCNDFEVKERIHPFESYKYEKFKETEEWVKDQSVEFDRKTALMVLNAISSRMRPSHDIFGNKTLEIDRYAFEAVRRKFLDRKETNHANIY